MVSLPPGTHALDDAFRLMRMLVNHTGALRIDVTCYCDGRVRLDAYDTHGHHVWQEHADVHDDPLDRKPSAAFCDAWRRHGEKP